MIERGGRVIEKGGGCDREGAMVKRGVVIGMGGVTGRNDDREAAVNERGHGREGMCDREGA